MTTLTDITGTVKALRTHFGGSIQISLDVWNYSHSEGETPHNWNVWVSAEDKHYRFNSWAKLMHWVEDLLYPSLDIDDNLQIEEDDSDIC